MTPPKNEDVLFRNRSSTPFLFPIHIILVIIFEHSRHHFSSVFLAQSRHAHSLLLDQVVTTREASESARAAASLCIGLLAGQRPSLPIPPSVVESIAGMLISEPDEGHRLASYAAEALGALSVVPSAERQFGDQGVVEMLVVRAGTGDTESCTSAATVLAALARRRR